MRLVMELQTSSKNQFFKAENHQHPFLVKVFPQTSHGRTSARKEWQAAQFLWEKGFRRIPRYFDHSEGRVTMEWLPDIQKVNAREAYAHLFDFLTWTHRFKAPWSVSDDCDDSTGFLRNLAQRLQNLEIDHSLKFELQKFYEMLSEKNEWKFGVFPKRFILSDFHPGQVVSSDRKIFFLDMEDAGMGDPRRFLCNLLLHPQGKITLEQLEALRSILGVTFEQMASVFPFSYMEWILIFLNGFSPERRSQETEIELKERTKTAWQWLQRARQWRHQCPSWLELYLKEWI